MSTALLEIRGLDVTFRRTKLLPWSDAHEVRAVRGLDLVIDEHETVGLVGESGSGKTTTGRALLHLVPITAGSVRLGEHRVEGFGRTAPEPFRRQVQAVFQDPVASLNPAMTVARIIGEPLELHESLDRSAQRTRAGELLELVGLGPGHLDGTRTSSRADSASASRSHARWRPRRGWWCSTSRSRRSTSRPRRAS